MISNQLVLIYLTVSGFAVALGLIGIFQGTCCLRLWPERENYEKRHRLEKRIYALMSVFIPLFIWRLLALPLWFGTLKSLIPSIPGAMCLYGVVAAAPLGLGGASLGQLLLPFLLSIWFMWRRFDHQHIAQPLLKSEVILALGIGAGIVLLSGLEVGTLVSVKPRLVHCCTSLFDQPQFRTNSTRLMGKFPVMLLEWWMAFWVLVSVWLKFTAWKPAQKGSNTLWITLAAGISFGATILFMIEILAPRLLRLPLHHCPFCLLERSLPTLLVFTAWYGALIFGVGATWAVCFSRLETADLIGWIRKKEGWVLGIQTLALLCFIYLAT